jgi:hypothetical protein
MKTTTTTNYTTGEELLRKAVAKEKETCRYYGQYVQWVVAGDISIEVITTQLMEAKGWHRQTARKAAENVRLLGETENRSHLEALLNGEISFDIARMRVGKATGSGSSATPYQDDETATMYLHKAVAIMTQRHKKWSQKELLDWIIKICSALLKRTPDAKTK